MFFYFQWWNQLTKFQRSIIYMLILVGFITVVYFFPANSNSPVLVEPFIEHHNDINALKKEVLVNKPTLINAELQQQLQAITTALTKQNVIEEPQVNNINGGDFINNNQIAVPPNILPVKFEGPTNDRQKAVVNAFKHAWAGYKQFAWGHDHLRPISGGYQDWFGLGLTIVDSLDTIYIMGLKEGKFVDMAVE